MCIVIDVNTLALVFNTKSEGHAEFAPVKKWIDEGKGFVIFGGTKYKAELEKTYRYARLIRQMRDGGQAISILDSAVDTLEAEVQKKTQRTECNDQHIIALLGASRCSLLCSGDKKSFRFVRTRALYPQGMRRVKVYTSSKHTRLFLIASKSSLTNVG